MVAKSLFHTYMSSRVEPTLRHQEKVEEQRKGMNDKLVKSNRTERQDIPDMKSALEKVRQSKKGLPDSLVRGLGSSPYK